MIARRFLALCRSMVPGNAAAQDRHEEGATVVEFAVCAPAFFMLCLTIFDIGHMAYADAVMKGAVQAAARSSSLESGSIEEADAKIEALMARQLPGSTVITSRVSYADFSDIGRPELWNDANGNGTCDDGENYTDENGSGQWEDDVGTVDSNGGANDVIIYTVTADYTSKLTIPNFNPGHYLHSDSWDPWGPRRLKAVAVRRNQPFALQNEYGSTVGSCP